MRRILLGLAFLVFANLSGAQVTPDHVFPNQVFQLNLESSGFKYFHVDTGLRKITLYNDNYTFFKEITYPVPSSSGNILHLNISEHLMNTDDNIEVFYSSWSSDSARYYVIDEFSNVLFYKADHYDFFPVFAYYGVGVSNILGLPALIAVPFWFNGGASYYLPPSYSLYYQSGSTMISHRLKFEVSGEKFGSWDYGTSAYFDNVDGSPWKIILSPFSTSCPIDNSIFKDFSEHIFNSDDSLEGIYHFSNDCSPDSFAIVNENGTILLKGPGYTNLYTFGSVSKLLVHDGSQTLVYGCPGLSLEHVFSNQTQMLNFDYSGPKFENYETDGHHLYNLDYSLWKIIPSSLFSTGNLSEHLICPDDQLEGFGAINSSGVDTIYTLNEAANKLIITVGTGWGISSDLSNGKALVYTSGETRIFNLPLCSPENVGTLSAENPFTLYPNPASTILNIDLADEKGTYTLSNVQGQVIRTSSLSRHNEIDISNLAAGVYEVSLLIKGQSYHQLLSVK